MKSLRIESSRKFACKLYFAQHVLNIANQCKVSSEEVGVFTLTITRIVNDSVDLITINAFNT